MWVSNDICDFSDFAGVWALERDIEDRLSGRDGHLIGQATLTADGDGLKYHETGELTFEGQPTLIASRVYLWRRGRGGVVTVQFEDGTPFHDFTLHRTMPEATHFCEPDMYYATYDFARWPVWTSTWRVVGPRKNYRSLSRYQRRV